MTRIPLFPLEVVLFPGMPLPLHIFEPRYQQMIGECLAAHTQFGVALAVPGDPARLASIGCMAEIVQLVKSYPDGRMDILTAGRNVFRISEVHDEKPYHEASVEFIADEPGAAPAEAQQETLRLFEQCYAAIFERPAPPPDPATLAALSYAVAHAMPFSLELKQAVLELRSEPQRLALVGQHLQELLPELRKASRLRKVAGGNGRGQH